MMAGRNACGLLCKYAVSRFLGSGEGEWGLVVFIDWMGVRYWWAFRLYIWGVEVEVEVEVEMWLRS